MRGSPRSGASITVPSSIASDELTIEKRITLDDSVPTALRVVLEQLTPGEHVASVMQDIFQISFDDFARITKRTPSACRQLASRSP